MKQKRWAYNKYPSATAYRVVYAYEISMLNAVDAFNDMCEPNWTEPNRTKESFVIDFYWKSFAEHSQCEKVQEWIVYWLIIATYVNLITLTAINQFSKCITNLWQPNFCFFTRFFAANKTKTSIAFFSFYKKQFDQILGRRKMILFVVMNSNRSLSGAIFVLRRDFHRICSQLLKLFKTK